MSFGLSLAKRDVLREDVAADFPDSIAELRLSRKLRENELRGLR